MLLEDLIWTRMLNPALVGGRDACWFAAYGPSLNTQASQGRLHLMVLVLPRAMMARPVAPNDEAGGSKRRSGTAFFGQLTVVNGVKISGLY